MSKCKYRPATVTEITGRDYTDVTPTHQHHLERKSEFGTLVHKLIADHGEDNVQIPQIAEEFGYLAAEALAKYRMLLVTHPVLKTATCIQHELPIRVQGISGQMDWLGKVVDEDGYTRPLIADIKTSDDEETATYQLSLYAYMYESKYDIRPIIARIQLVPGKAVALIRLDHTPKETVRKLIKERKEKNNDNDRNQ